MLSCRGLNPTLNTCGISGQPFPKRLPWCKQQPSLPVGERSRNSPVRCPCPGQAESSETDTGAKGSVGHGQHPLARPGRGLTSSKPTETGSCPAAGSPSPLLAAKSDHSVRIKTKPESGCCQNKPKGGCYLNL